MLDAVFDKRDAVGVVPRQERVVGAKLLDEAAIAGAVASATTMR